MYKLEYTKTVIKDLRKLDKHDRQRIYDWIDKNLLSIDNPRQKGKALKGDLREYWCYRVGNYRLITIIEDEKLLIHALNIAHRREVYKKL